MKVILIGNYRPDKQWSMQHHTELLEGICKRNAIETETIFPPCLFGKIAGLLPGLQKWFGYIDKFIIFPLLLRLRLNRYRGRTDLLVHITDHSNALYIDDTLGLRTVISCHDVIAIRAARGDFSQTRVGRTGRLLQSWILKSLAKAQTIVCISESTRRDLAELLPIDGKQIPVVHMPLSYPFRHLEQELVRERLAAYEIPENARVIFHCGADAWYKNRDGVLRVFAECVNGHKRSELFLVLCGAKLNSEQRRFIRNQQMAEQVLSLAAVEVEILEALYSRADLFLFPSYYEGFGWPPLEAQACGCPVVSSSLGSLAEVLGSSALIGDVVDEAELVRNVLQLLDSKELAEHYRAKGYENIKRFDLEKMSEDYREIYHQAVTWKL